MSHWLMFGCLLSVCGCGSDTAPSAGSGSGSGGSAFGSAGDHAAVVAKLRTAIDERYSYRDRLGLDWNALFTEAQLEKSPSREPLITGLRKLLGNAKDAHLDLIVDGKFIPTDPSKIVWNFSLAQIQRKVADWKNPGKCLSIGRLGDYAYVLVNGLEKGRCDNLPADWAAIYPQLATSPGMIMDLRGNGGGNEVFAQQIAGYFVDKLTPYVKAQTRDVKAPGGFQREQVRAIEPVAGVTRYSKPVAVLSGPLIMSSAESFLLMMRAAGATVVGGRSRGASANPVIVDLGEGISVRIPTWRATLIDGGALEGVGVKPDVEITVTPTEVTSGDKIIDAAVVELDKRVGKTR